MSISLAMSYQIWGQVKSLLLLWGKLDSKSLSSRTWWTMKKCPG